MFSWRKFGTGLLTSGLVCLGLLILGMISFGILMLPLLVILPVALYMVGVRLYRAKQTGNIERTSFLTGIIIPLAFLTVEVFHFMWGFLIQE